MVLLLDITDFSVDKLIPQITDQPRLKAKIMEAQEFDLQPLLGDMYYDLCKNKTASNYVKLLTGEEYQNSAGHTINFPGLKMALKYWTYARYISFQQSTVTTHSLVTKTNPFSVPTERKDVEAQVEDSRSGAIAFWEQTKKYLNTKKSLFPLWIPTDAKARGGVRITAIGGNQ